MRAQDRKSSMGQDLKRYTTQILDNYLKVKTASSDRDINNWEKRLKMQVDRAWENYLRLNVDLTVARNIEKLTIPGEFLYVENVSSKSALATIRINRNSNEAINLELGSVIKTVFKEFYLTNTAQTSEWIDLIVGINFEYYKNQRDILSAEAQACVILTNALPNVNTVVAAHPCNRALLRAHIGNAGTAWIDFGTPAVVNACYELTAGDALSLPCSNTNRINGIFTAGGDNVTIVYEV